MTAARTRKATEPKPEKAAPEAPQALTPATSEQVENRQATNQDVLARLRAPFADGEIGKLPKSTCSDCSSNRGTCSRHPDKFKCQICGNYHSDSSIHIDYVGHADVTARLLEVDPFWTWEPAHKDPATGEPSVFASMDRDGNLWIRLTVGGVTRLGVGDGKNAKERIGDALRNAAMRFGVALDLWAKGDREWAHAEKDSGDEHPDPTPPVEPVAAGKNPPPGPDRRLYTEDPEQVKVTMQLIPDLAKIATEQGTDLAGITAKWRENNGGIPADDLVKIHPEAIATLIDQITAYIASKVS